MREFNKLLWFFPKGIYFESFRSEKLKQAFEQEINYTNFLRLRILSAIVFFICLVMLILDFSSSQIWDEPTLNRFKILDLSVVFYLIAVSYFLFIGFPKNKAKLKRGHILTFNASLFFFIVWSALVSASEWTASGGMPTFIIGTFVICSIFITNGSFIIMVLFCGLACLFGGLLLFNIEITQIIRQYFYSIFLVVLAYTISRILMYNSIKTFIAKTELENTNTGLDDLVKERTIELINTNNRLKDEILERERYEIQLQKEKDRAEESDKLKSSFLANMSHEIRTPLNGIVGFSDLMQSPYLSEEKRDKYSTLIKKKSHQLLKIIDDIIDISLIDSNQMKLKYSTTSVQHIIDLTIENFHSMLHFTDTKKIDFELVNLLDEKEIEIHTDSFRVQQTILNLLDNAYKFTQSGYIKLIVRKDDNELLFCVEDTGIGINYDKSEVIFERFIQADSSSTRAFGGTGLGLSISSGIVRLLNGKIWLDFSYDRGSRFCFTLPLKHPLQQHTASEKLSINEKLVHNKKILISTNSKRHFLFFNKLFHHCEVEQTSRLFESSFSAYDIIIMENDNNIDLPKFLGENAGCGVFVLSENVSAVTSAQTKYLNLKHYSTPINLHKLILDINSFLASKE